MDETYTLKPNHTLVTQNCQIKDDWFTAFIRQFLPGPDPGSQPDSMGQQGFLPADANMQDLEALMSGDKMPSQGSTIPGEFDFNSLNPYIPQDGTFEHQGLDGKSDTSGDSEHMYYNYDDEYYDDYYPDEYSDYYEEINGGADASHLEFPDAARMGSYPRYRGSASERHKRMAGRLTSNECLPYNITGKNL